MSVHKNLSKIRVLHLQEEHTGIPDPAPGIWGIPDPAPGVWGIPGKRKRRKIAGDHRLSSLPSPISSLPAPRGLDSFSTTIFHIHSNTNYGITAALQGTQQGGFTSTKTHRDTQGYPGIPRDDGDRVKGKVQFMGALLLEMATSQNIPEGRNSQ